VQLFFPFLIVKVSMLDREFTWETYGVFITSFVCVTIETGLLFYGWRLGRCASPPSPSPPMPHLPFILSLLNARSKNSPDFGGDDDWETVENETATRAANNETTPLLQGQTSSPFQINASSSVNDETASVSLLSFFLFRPLDFRSNESPPCNRPGLSPLRSSPLP